jgi:hypothetical protein
MWGGAPSPDDLPRPGETPLSMQIIHSGKGATANSPAGRRRQIGGSARGYRGRWPTAQQSPFGPNR